METIEEDPILDKANKILIEMKFEKRKALEKSKRDKRIIKAGLCPKCGEKLIILKKYEDIDNYIKKHSIHSNYDYTDLLNVCSIDSNHYLKIKGSYSNYEEEC